MNANMEMIISDSRFCRKIINKYKQGQRNSFGLPRMIFHKKAGRILGHNIHMNIMFRLNPVDRKIVSSSILKSVQNIQGAFSWFGSEKCILQPTARSAMIKDFTCVNKVLPQIPHETASRFFSVKDVSVGGLIYIRSIPYVFRRAENMIPALKKVRKVGRAVLKIAKAVSCLHTDFKDLSSNFTVIRQRYNTTRIFQMINFQTGKRRRFSIKGIEGRYPSSPKEKTGKIFPEFEYQLPAILPQVDLLLNKKSNEVSQKLLKGNKLFIKHHQYITGDSLLFVRWEKRLFDSLQLKKSISQDLKINQRKQSPDRIYNLGAEAVHPMADPLSTVFKPESVNFHFNTQRMIEKEVKEIKKIIVETKEEVKEKSIPGRSFLDMDIKKHFDINRLSDQVYRNIEQRIRMERERRGV